MLLFFTTYTMRRKKTPEEEMDNDQNPLRPKSDAGWSGGKDGGGDSKETIQNVEDDHENDNEKKREEQVRKDIYDVLTDE